MKTFRFLLIAVVCILAGGRGIALGQCVPPPSGMVAWWPLDETSGPTAFDFAGIHQDNGTHMNTPTPTPGKVDSALCFNGIDQYVEVADDAEIDFDTLDFSIDGWIKTTDSVGTKVFLDKREDTPAYRGYELYLYNGNLGLQLADGTYTNWTSTAFVADGTWRHFAVTVDRNNPSGIVFYRDGTSISTFDPTSHSGSLDNSSVLRMACRSFYLSGFFNGCLDEIDLFNRVLTQAEIQAIYNADSLGKCKLTLLPDHYKTWRIQPLPFDTIVFVQDQFMSDSLQLGALDFLSNPVNKVAQNYVNYISKPNNHLTWYRAYSLGSSVKQFEVDYVNQIESTSV